MKRRRAMTITIDELRSRDRHRAKTILDRTEASIHYPPTLLYFYRGDLSKVHSSRQCRSCLALFSRGYRNTQSLSPLLGTVLSVSSCTDATGCLENQESLSSYLVVGFANVLYTAGNYFSKANKRVPFYSTFVDVLLVGQPMVDCE